MALRTVLAILAVIFLTQGVNCTAIRLLDWIDLVEIYQKVRQLKMQ